VINREKLKAGYVFMFDYKKKGMHFFAALIFILAIFSVHFYFYLSGGYMTTRNTDATVQLLFFRYFLHHQFLNGDFFWSWKYGLGGDVFSNFSYYYSTSIFFLITLFLKFDTLQEVLHLNIIISSLKLFSAMIFMYALLQYNKRSYAASILGALIYGGSTFFAGYSERFDFMAEAFVWLPLLILAYDRFVDENKKGFFIFMVFIVITTNFYFGFMSSVYLNIYAVFKYFLTSQPYSLKGFITYYIKLIKYYIVGFLLSAFAFFPTVYSFLHAGRFDKDYDIPLLYTNIFYHNVVYNFFYPYSASQTLGMSIVGLVAILLSVLYIKQKEMLVRLCLLIFMICLYFFPFAYSFFNGLSAMQPRWIYMLIFTCGMVAAYAIDFDKKDSKYRNFYLILIFAAFLLYVFYVPSPKDLPYDKIQIVFFTALIGIFLLRFKIKQVFFLLCIIIVAICSIGYNNFMMFTQDLGNYQTQKASTLQTFSGSGYDNEADKQVIQYIQQSDSSFYRIMWNQINKENIPLYYNYNGFSSYQSLIPNNVHSFFKETYNIAQMDSPSRYSNLDHRLYLETALMNKYYIVRSGDSFSPYGFTLLKELNGYKVYKNDHYLPVGFIYDQAVSVEQFNQLDEVQKDQLMLQAAVVEQAGSLEKFNTKKLRSEVLFKGMDNVKLENIDKNGDIYTARPNASIQIPLNNKHVKAGETILKMNLKNLTTGSLILNINGINFEKRSVNNIYSYPKDNYAFNIQNLQNNGMINISLSPGQYNIKDVEVLFNSYEKYTDSVDELKQSELKNVHYDENSLQGKVNAKKSGLLFLSVPYSKGWHIKVDGKDTEFEQVNGTFIGVRLSKGKHDVSMHYVTPYFKESFAISIFTAIGIMIVYLIKKRRKVKSSN
jgi:uncharacterized membrane protein YfhO